MGFVVNLNNQMIYKYKETRIPGRLLRHLDRMEKDMQNGINLGGQWVESPSELQKHQYVALVLFDSLQNNNSNLVNITSAYLLDRKKSLSQINITQHEDQFALNLISS